MVSYKKKKCTKKLDKISVESTLEIKEPDSNNSKGASLQNVNNTKNLSSKQALKKLKRKMNASGVKD